MSESDHPTRPEHHRDMASSGESNSTTDAAKNEQLRLAPGMGVQFQTTPEALLYKHPLYQQNINKWEKFVDAYEARNMANYIYKHVRESTDVYDVRVRRHYFLNYCASLVDLLVSYIYQSPILREVMGDLKDDFEEIYKDANLRGDSWNTMFKQGAVYANVTGHHGILVDMPVMPDGGFTNEAARLEAGHRPYLCHVFAWQIQDWELDRYGNFVWVKLQVPTQRDRTFQTSVDMETKTYVIWTKDSWEKYELRERDKVAELVDSGVHGLGRVPLVIIPNQPLAAHGWMGKSTIYEIADINIAIMNWCSMADEEIFERCLNVLTMEHSDDNPVELSHNNVLEYPAGATHPPEYLTPGATPLEMIGQWLDRARREIYRLAKLGGAVGTEKQGAKQATSGIAYAFEFNETNQTLADKATNLERAERQAHEIVALWYDGKEYDGTVEYPKEFGVQDPLLEMQVLAEARLTVTSDSAVKKIESRVLRRMFSQENSEFIETVLNEVEEGDPRGPEPALLDQLPTLIGHHEKVEPQPKPPKSPAGSADSGKGDKKKSADTGKKPGG